jgi:dihydroxy-acid dehydratase
MDVLVDLDVIEDRKQRFTPIAPRYDSGVLAKYARLVGSAETGAVLD